jgi:hypothetical protein
VRSHGVSVHPVLTRFYASVATPLAHAWRTCATGCADNQPRLACTLGRVTVADDDQARDRAHVGTTSRRVPGNKGLGYLTERAGERVDLAPRYCRCTKPAPRSTNSATVTPSEQWSSTPAAAASSAAGTFDGSSSTTGACSGATPTSLMIARRRADVAELNLRARQLLRQVGELGPEEIALPGGGFAVGDQVIIKRNVSGLDVSNGERGRVVAIGERGVALQCGDRRVDLDAAFLLEPTEQGEPSLVHGYAITGHVAQGLTTERTFVLADVGGTREWLYVAMSRGRQSNRLYIADADRARDEFAPVDPHRPDAWRRLAASVARSEALPMAIDLAAEAARDRRGDLRQWLATRRTRLDCDNDFGIDR